MQRDVAGIEAHTDVFAQNLTGLLRVAAADFSHRVRAFRPEYVAEKRDRLGGGFEETRWLGLESEVDFAAGVLVQRGKVGGDCADVLGHQRGVLGSGDPLFE